MRSLWANPSSWSHFLQQANIFFRTDPNEHLIPQDWSLTVELTISFWMPFLIALSLQGAAALIVFSVVSVVFMQAYGFVFHFMAGILIAKYFTDVQIWLGQRTVVQKTGILISALVLYGYRYLEVQLPPGIRFSGETMGIWYLTGLGACLLLISAIGSRRIQNFLRMPILVRLGRISYSFYLIHLAVLMHFTSYFLKTINRMGMDGRILASLLGFVATFIVTFVLSDISYRMIELPSIRLGKIAQSLFFDTDRRH
jgi:peptidoglycan/LPS O-acetylase OafA/YrhL